MMPISLSPLFGWRFRGAFIGTMGRAASADATYLLSYVHFKRVREINGLVRKCR